MDDTVLHALNDIACDAAKGTERTLEATDQLLNCIACNPRPAIRHQASDVVLQVNSDAAFQVQPEARSRAGGCHCLGSKGDSLFNAPILVLTKVIKNVMGSAAEAKVAALHLNAQEAVPIRQALEEMGHPQPATRIRTDNATAQGLVNDSIEIKRSKTFDRQFWWLNDREAQEQFDTVWDAGICNPADHPTKHHSASHHQKARPICLCEGDSSPTHLQGCIKILREDRRTDGCYALLLYACNTHIDRRY